MMKSVKAMKAPVKAKNWHIGRMLMVLAAILAQSALAVTYSGTLPIAPVHPRYAFGSSFVVAVDDTLAEYIVIDDEEYEVIPTNLLLHWQVRDSSDTLVAELDGAAATVTSSLPDGIGFIHSPCEYTITFTGSAAERVKLRYAQWVKCHE